MSDGTGSLTGPTRPQSRSVWLSRTRPVRRRRGISSESGAVRWRRHSIHCWGWTLLSALPDCIPASRLKPLPGLP